MAGLYIHVPFCQKRCLYCDFYSNTDMGYQEAYLSALIREMELRKNYLEGETLETIYFGGGTPSQLSVENLNQIFEAIYRHFPVNQDMEITLEANPDDMTPAYVAALRSLPVNRISMGVQSFDAADLKFLNRRHDREEALRAVRLCQEHNLYNISIDLIYGLPGQTPEKWQKNLDEVLRLDIPHISAYHLIYEEGTALWKLREQHRMEEADEELSVSLFTLLIHKLKEKGYQHYEISNFCLPGMYSRHNSSYWTGKKYLGCGPSAHSYNGVSRQWNISSLDEYITNINEGEPYSEIEELNLYTRYNDFVITTIRTMWGMNLDMLKKTFGSKLYDYCLRMAYPHLQQGTLEQSEGVLKLTEKGIFISDGIMSDMLWVD